MSMTKIDRERKHNVIKFMSTTAEANGKDGDWLHITYVAERLHRIETTLSRLNEMDCEGDYIRYMEREGEAKRERLEALAERIVFEEIGCKCETQRDPRGYAIRMYLQDDDGRKWFNTWDGETTGLAW